MSEPYSIERLALFGGAPAFPEPLHVGRPNLGDRARLLERMEAILDRRWLSNDGPCVQELEARIAVETGTAHCVAVCNATVGLEIAVRALGLTGEVLVPSFTFVATAHALQWLGLTPVFCDIEPQRHHLDPGKLAERISPRTSAIMAVHLWGELCDTESLAAVAEQHGLTLLFDAAHAYHCTRGGRPAGGNGALEVFSFHATKFVNAFEGGAITTNDPEVARRLRLMRNFGFETYDVVSTVGTNGKMSEISAAMALTSLEALESIVATNWEHRERYRAGLAGLPGVRLLDGNPRERRNAQYLVLEVDAQKAGIHRDDLVRLLWAENVRARRYFYPGCHRMEPYATLYPEAARHLPVTERIADRVLVLPTGTGVTGDEVDGICGLLRFLIENGPAIRTRLEAEAA